MPSLLAHGGSPDILPADLAWWTPHAWVEHNGMAYDSSSTEPMPVEEYRQKLQARPEQVYSQSEAIKKAMQNEHYGPWNDPRTAAINPVNHQNEPLIQDELQQFGTLSPSERLYWRRKSRALNQRARRQGAPGVVQADELHALMNRFGHSCAYCDQPFTDKGTFDHVIPLGMGGQNTADNIVPACLDCNRLLNDWTLGRPMSAKQPPSQSEPPPQLTMLVTNVEQLSTGDWLYDTESGISFKIEHVFIDYYGRRGFDVYHGPWIDESEMKDGRFSLLPRPTSRHARRITAWLDALELSDEAQARYVVAGKDGLLLYAKEQAGDGADIMELFNLIDWDDVGKLLTEAWGFKKSDASGPSWEFLRQKQNKPPMGEADPLIHPSLEDELKEYQYRESLRDSLLHYDKAEYMLRGGRDKDDRPFYPDQSGGWVWDEGTGTYRRTPPPQQFAPRPLKATRLVRNFDNSIGLKYHNTQVVKFHPTGNIELNTGGWYSRTTMDRMNYAKGVDVFRQRPTEKGVPNWWVSTYATRAQSGVDHPWGDKKAVKYFDGMIVDPNGQVLNPEADPGRPRYHYYSNKWDGLDRMPKPLSIWEFTPPQRSEAIVLTVADVDSWGVDFRYRNPDDQGRAWDSMARQTWLYWLDHGCLKQLPQRPLFAHVSADKWKSLRNEPEIGSTWQTLPNKGGEKSFGLVVTDVSDGSNGRLVWYSIWYGDQPETPHHTMFLNDFNRMVAQGVLVPREQRSLLGHVSAAPQWGLPDEWNEEDWWDGAVPAPNDAANPPGMPRPMYENLPVPWTADINMPFGNDPAEPAFARMDSERSMRAWSGGLCVLCGLKLTDPVYAFVLPDGRPVDGPLHPRCAAMVRAHCPHIRDEIQYGNLPLMQMPLATFEDNSWLLQDREETTDQSAKRRVLWTVASENKTAAKWTPAPRVHVFSEGTGEAYDDTQTGYWPEDWQGHDPNLRTPGTDATYDELMRWEKEYDKDLISVQDGDVLVVPSEGVVGIMVSAWPVAVTENTGEFHRLDPELATLFPDERSSWRNYEDGKYAKSYELAIQEAQKLGVKVARTSGWSESGPNGDGLTFQPGDRVELPSGHGFGTVIEVDPPEMDDPPFFEDDYQEGDEANYQGTYTTWMRVKKDDGEVVRVADSALRFVQGLDGGTMPDTLPWKDDEQDYYRTSMAAKRPPSEQAPQFSPGDRVRIAQDPEGQMISPNTGTVERIYRDPISQEMCAVIHWDYAANPDLHSARRFTELMPDTYQMRMAGWGDADEISGTDIDTMYPADPGEVNADRPQARFMYHVTTGDPESILRNGLTWEGKRRFKPNPQHGFNPEGVYLYDTVDLTRRLFGRSNAHVFKVDTMGLPMEQDMNGGTGAWRVTQPVTPDRIEHVHTYVPFERPLQPTYPDDPSKPRYRQAMAERTGDPTLDKLIEEFMTANQTEVERLNPTEDDWYQPLDAMRDSGGSSGWCHVLASQFATFLTERGVEAYSTEDDFPAALKPDGLNLWDTTPDTLGLHDRSVPGAGRHVVTVIERPTGTYSVDWTAAQYGYKEFPMVQKLDDGGGWQRDFTSANQPSNPRLMWHCAPREARENLVQDANQRLNDSGSWDRQWTAAAPQQMIHIAPASQRASILQHGIDYTKGSTPHPNYPGYGEEDVYPLGNYLWVDEWDGSTLYAERLAEQLEEPMDMWLVNAQGLKLNLDPQDETFSDPENGFGPTGFYSAEPIPASLLKLEGTIYPTSGPQRQWTASNDPEGIWPHRVPFVCYPDGAYHIGNPGQEHGSMPAHPSDEWWSQSGEENEGQYQGHVLVDHPVIGTHMTEPLDVRQDDPQPWSWWTPELQDQITSEAVARYRSRLDADQQYTGKMSSADLSRFVEAQEPVYQTALSELQAGQKRTHWMWYIFPQIAGLGSSPMAQRYALSSLDEAREYAADPILGQRLLESAQALLALPQRDTAELVLGGIDAMKLKSSMTLFARATGNPVFQEVLNRFYGGEHDAATDAILNQTTSSIDDRMHEIGDQLAEQRQEPPREPWTPQMPQKAIEMALYKHQCPMCRGYLRDRGGVYTCTACPFEWPQPE